MYQSISSYKLSVCGVTGGQTPVSQPRGSVQSVGKDTRDANSSKENSLNRVSADTFRLCVCLGVCRGCRGE